MRPKSHEFYFEKGLNKNFDLALFLEYCELDRKPETLENDCFFVKARREYEEFMKKDLVVDTRESWTDVFRRLRDFEEQKLIPREELPAEYQPHSSFYNKMANWAAGIDHRRPADHQVRQGAEIADVEMEAQVEDARE